ncbi:phosphate/phosphite/phosphonate ABC transporter substrate-binding protein [Sphingomonas sp. GlSt437]|uniref:phosphate/phosphite/phosphonate ABC transporter substrate-binding protein n=1 Tax=Sphingomonas sp. GlSt437 TaxID=3389970 RepID=UPI003A8B0E15
MLALSACGSEQNGQAGWRGQVNELRISVPTPSLVEPSGRSTSLGAFQDYMATATGLPVRVRQTTDIYTSTIQALSSGQVDVALIAGGGYANAHEQIGNLVAPQLIMIGAHGETGYYSSLIVRADSPYHSIADLKGKSLAVVDYNSTSGYLYPMHAMRGHGIDPERYFSRIGVAGGHPQAVSAVYNQQYDAAWSLSSNGTPKTGFAITTWDRMADRGMIPHGAIRDIWDVGPVPNLALAVRTDRPQALQDLVRGAMAAIPYDAPEVFRAFDNLPGVSFTAGNDSMFAETYTLRKEAIADQRASANGAAPQLPH